MGSNNGSLILTDLRQKKSNQRVFNGSNEAVYFITSLENTVMISSKDFSFSFYDIRSSRLICNNRSHSTQIVSIDRDSVNKRFISSSKDGAIKIWNTNGTLEKNLKSPSSNCLTTMYLNANQVYPANTDEFMMSKT